MPPRVQQKIVRLDVCAPHPTTHTAAIHIFTHTYTHMHTHTHTYTQVHTGWGDMGREGVT